jgi:hypothetical protein
MTYVPKIHNHTHEGIIYRENLDRFGMSLLGLVNTLAQSYEEVSWEYPVDDFNMVVIRIYNNGYGLKVCYSRTLIEQGYSDPPIIWSILREIKEKFDVSNIQCG